MSAVDFGMIGLLNDNQRGRLLTIEWLLDQMARAEGRSTLMSVAFIRQAIRYPGHWIDVFDHAPSRDMRQDRLDEVRKFIDSYLPTANILL